RSGREGSSPLLCPVALDNVTDLEVVEILDANAALEPGPDFLHVILEAPQRPDAPRVDLGAVPDHAHATFAIDDPGPHRAPGNDADLRDLEQLAHLGVAIDDLALLRPQQPFERRPNLGHRLIDDAIELDLDAFALGRRARVVVGPDVEPDDDRARGLGQQHVALADGADATVNDLDLDFAGRQLPERVGQRFGRTSLVRLDHDTQRAALTSRRLRHDVFEGDTRACGRATIARLAIQPLALLCRLTRIRRVFDDDEHITGGRDALDAQHLDRNRGTSCFDRLVALIEQRPDTTRVHADDKVVADFQRPIFDED